MGHRPGERPPTTAATDHQGPAAQGQAEDTNSFQPIPNLYLPIHNLALALPLIIPFNLPAHVLLLLGHLEGQQSVGPLLPLRLHLHLPQGEEEEVVDPELVAAGDDVLLLPDPAGSGAPLPLPGHHTHGAGGHRVLEGLYGAI